MKTKIKTGMEIHPELQKQRQKIQELEKQIEEGEFGVVLVAGFLRGIRNSGYRNNAKALEELIDNSIQAGADNIQVRFGFDGKDPEKTDNPSFIAVMDDGHGMDKPWVRNCLSFGGTHRENDRSGFGRFGYGLKASCLSFGKSIKVFSKTADGNLWHSCEFDIEKVIEAKTGNNQTSRIPQAIQEDPPKDLLKWFNEHNNGAGSGTIIVIGKIDRERLSFKKHHALRDYLKKEFGIVYRNALQQRKILIEGNIKDGKQTADEVAPTDPLFIMPNSRFVNESGFAPAEAIPPHEFKILAENYAGEKNVYGTIRVRYSYMGPLFWDEHDKKSPRMAIRKRNHGITVCRNGREIDVVKPPTDWFVLSNNYLHAGVEIDFDPILDDDFGVTTNKQGVSINERIWDILKREGVCDEYKRLRSRFENDESVKEQTHDGKKTAEIVMDNAMGLLDNSSKELTVLAQKKGHENLVKIAENISKETGRGIDEVTQDLVIQTQKNRNKIQIKEMIGGPFFIPEQRGGQTVLIINSHHKFFTNVYGARTTSPEARNGIDLLLFAAAYAELRSTAEVQLIYENERRRISDQLNTLLGHLEILKSTAGTDSVSPTDI